MKTNRLLLIVGILGILFSVVGIIKDQKIITHIIGLVSSISLLLGYFELYTTNER